MAEPLATIDDVEVRLPTALDPAGLARVDALLRDASAVVRNYCRRQFTATRETVQVRPIGSRIRLPQRPVTAIHTVGVIFNDRVLAMPAYQWDGNDEIWLDVYGQSVINLSEAALELLHEDRTPLCQIDYTHGYPQVPEDVVAVVATMVSRAMTAPGDGVLQSQGTGPFNYQLTAAAAQGAMGLDTAARQILNAYRRTSTTVEMR